MEAQPPPDDAFAPCCRSLRRSNPPSILTYFFSPENLTRNPLSALNNCRYVSIYGAMVPYMIEVTMLGHGKLPHYFIPVPPNIQPQFPSIGEFVQWTLQRHPGNLNKMEVESFSRGLPFFWECPGEIYGVGVPHLQYKAVVLTAPVGAKLVQYSDWWVSLTYDVVHRGRVLVLVANHENCSMGET
ncbi:hypothetical protein BTUL_0055g00010 [Botrytis tulipae]|uniref:Uncharacterized protein n=1 Tax=Botrytis tulipae TaxID=87230 RepID=A0A4Z1EPH9_9HELO|nr:hypothetical protein BTUL_0055g00010 [Botrytis tulipae]